MGNTKPYPLYTDGVNLYTSFDGGVTLLPVGSGSNTVHTNATLTGDGSSGSPLGVVAVGWDVVQWNRIQAVLGANAGSITDYQWTDLLNTNEYTGLQNGTPNQVQLAGSTGGVVRIGVGGTGYVFPAGMQNNNPPTSAPVIVPIGNQQTQAWALAARVRIPSAASSGSHFYDLIDTSGITDGTGCGVRLNGNVSTTVLQVFQTSTNTACNAFGTLGGGTIAVNAFFDVLLVWDPIAGVMTCQINGNTAATVSGTANIPTQAAVIDSNSNVVGGLDVDAQLWAFGRMA